MRTTDLQEGMILDADALTLDGRCIASAGDRLTERHLKTLKAWGIRAVEIRLDEAVAPEGTGEMDSELQEVLDRAAARFADLPDDTIHESIRRVALRHAVEHWERTQDDD